MAKILAVATTIVTQIVTVGGCPADKLTSPHLAIPINSQAHSAHHWQQPPLVFYLSTHCLPRPPHIPTVHSLQRSNAFQRARHLHGHNRRRRSDVEESDAARAQTTRKAAEALRLSPVQFLRQEERAQSACVRGVQVSPSVGCSVSSSASHRYDSSSDPVAVAGLHDTATKTAKFRTTKLATETSARTSSTHRSPPHS